MTNEEALRLLELRIEAVNKKDLVDKEALIALSLAIAVVVGLQEQIKND